MVNAPAFSACARSIELSNLPCQNAGFGTISRGPIVYGMVTSDANAAFTGSVPPHRALSKDRNVGDSGKAGFGFGRSEAAARSLFRRSSASAPIPVVRQANHGFRNPTLGARVPPIFYCADRSSKSRLKSFNSSAPISDTAQYSRPARVHRTRL